MSKEKKYRDENLNDEEVEMLHQAIFNILKDAQRTKLKKLSHIKKYHMARKKHQYIGQKMIDYFYEHPEYNLSKPFQNSKGLKYVNREFNLNNQKDMHLFTELILYPHDINNDLCTYFLENKKVRSEENIKFVKAMQSSQIGLFEVLNTDYETGTCEIRNVLSGQRLILTDESMSMNKNLDDFYFVWRVIQYEDVNFQTGFSIAFSKKNIQRWVKKHKNHKIRLKELFELDELSKSEKIKMYVTR